MSRYWPAQPDTVYGLNHDGFIHGDLRPEYASPEQLRGDAIGAPSDAYSLGVVLYRVLLGTYPYKYTGRLLYQITDAILNQEPIS